MAGLLVFDFWGLAFAAGLIWALFLMSPMTILGLYAKATQKSHEDLSSSPFSDSWNPRNWSYIKTAVVVLGGGLAYATVLGSDFVGLSYSDSSGLIEDISSKWMSKYDAYMCRLKISTDYGEIQVSSLDYCNFHSGSRVKLRLAKGRFTGKIYADPKISESI